MTNGKRVVRGMRSGFSLLEISLVVVLIGLLTAGAAVALLGRSEKAKVRITKTTMTTLSGEIDSFIAEGNGTPPQSLQVLVSEDFIKSSMLVDAWKQPFYYNPTGASAGQRYTLLSYGPDRQAGTLDDINVWTMDMTTD